MPKVYITQDNGRLDFSKAKRFGELVPVTSGEVFPDNSMERSLEVTGIVSAVLCKFKPAEDFVLLTGDPIIIAISCLFLGHAFPTVTNFLKWDRENKEYYVVKL